MKSQHPNRYHHGGGLLSAALFFALLSPVLAQREVRTWVPLDARNPAPANSPVQLEILSATPTETQVRVLVPGFWQSATTYGGRQFAKIELPDQATVRGKGFPEKPGAADGWWEFPANLRQPQRDPSLFFAAAKIASRKPYFPESALGTKANTEVEMKRLGIDVAGARPAIPRLRWLLAASRRNTPNTLTVQTETKARVNYQVSAPLLPAGFDDSDQQERFGFKAPELIDDEFYRAFKGSYVGSEAEADAVSGMGSFTGAPVSLALYDVTSPTTFVIKTDFTVVIKHLAGAEDYDCPLDWDAWMNLPPFLNGAAILESLTKKGLAIQASRGAHYLILTPRKYRDTLDEFAKWKQAKGLSVDFAFVGDDVAADRNAIDAYIEAYFKKNYCHGVYVLLVGDVDAVPTGRSNRVTGTPDTTDADSDHVYEVLGSDRFPSLYVGRLSVDDAEQLKAQLAKILSYERSPVAGSWPKQASLAANSQNDNDNYGVDPTHPSKYAKAVNDIAAYGGYSNPPTFQKLHAGAANNATVRATNADLVNAINAGRGQVLYRGHGNGSTWTSGWDGSSATGASWGATQVNLLNNSAFPIVYGIACQTSRLRNNDCLGENFMARVAGGAVAYYGASVNSWTGENHERAKGIFQAIYESGYTRLGPALARAEFLSYISTGGGSNWDSNTFAYILLGDPELTIRKREVLRIDPKLVAEGLASNLAIGAFDADGAALAGAFVNATLSDGSVFNGFTGPDGKLLLPASAKSVREFLVLADGYGQEIGRGTAPEPAKPRFVAFQPNATASSLCDGSVRKVTPQETSLTLTIPGVTIEEIKLGDRVFSKLVYNDIKLSGLGFPQKPGERGWYDFPRETGLPAKNASAYDSGLSIVVPQSVFPRKAVGQKPRTAREMIALGIDPAGAQPGVPSLTGFLAASRKNTAKDLGLEMKKTTLKIQLAQPIAPAGYTGSDGPFSEGYDAPALLDEEFYANFQGAFQGRAAGLSEISGMGAGFSGSEIHVPLITVLSPTVIEVITGVEILVKHLAGTEDFTCPIPWDCWDDMFPFLNGAALRESFIVKGLEIEASRSARYLILTPRDWRVTLNEFALWKQAKGLNVDFAYVGGAPGDDVAANRNAIDSYLENYFKKYFCNGVYVLICGDVDVIPSGRSSRVTGDPDGADADSDHVYEVLGGERYPSMYVGRLSANSSDELKVQLDKILAYEKEPRVGDWPLRATLCANSQTDAGAYGVNASWPSKYAKAVRDIASYGGYTNPPSFQELHAGSNSASVTRATNADVTAAINAGRGQLLYRGHGDENNWESGWDGSGGNTSSGSSWTASANVNTLSNSIHPIVYAINCLNSRVNQSDCIAERWMSRSGGGAVAHFGATVTSYTTENHYRARGIFRSIYESGSTRLGPALGHAEVVSVLIGGSGGAWESNTFAYMLLGDPEMTIRKARVFGKLSASIGALANGVVVNVFNEAGKAVPGGFVQVSDLKGNHFNVFVGENGQGVIEGIKPESIAAFDVFADGFPALLEITKPQPPASVLARLEALGFGRGGFSLEIRNPANAKYRIFGSDNLVNWRELGVATPNGKIQEFLDATAPRGASRFYRAEEVR